MKPNLTSKVSVLIQGEDSNGMICDRNIDCQTAVVFGLTDDGVQVSTFGTLNPLEAAEVISAMKNIIEQLYEDFPGARLFEALSDVNVEDLMEGEEDA